MALFFTADTHFGDHRTLNIHRRPFGTVAEMDEALFTDWNAVVTPEDVVSYLGYVARRPADVAMLLSRRNGTKNLIRRNNDPAATEEAPGWASIGDYAELTESGHGLVLYRYPFRSWNGQHRRAINLHGHSHGRLKPMLRQCDVGVDARDFRPVRLAELLGSKFVPLPPSSREAVRS